MNVLNDGIFVVDKNLYGPYFGSNIDHIQRQCDQSDGRFDCGDTISCRNQ